MIETRLIMEAQFVKGEKSKNTLWNIVISRMKKTKPHLKLTGKEARTKFNNLMLTYKRNKKKKKQSGAAPINWKYFNRFDEVYGVRHSIEPPRSTIIDTLQDEENNVGGANNSEGEPHFPEANHEFPEDTSTHQNPKKGSQHDKLIAYWQQEDDREQVRHNERMQIEKQRNEIETNKIQVLLEIKDILEKLVDQ